MSLASTSTVDVRNGGSDTANGGTFTFGATLTADGAATLANTTAPVFTSASYSFVAGDVGAWLFIQSGSNWIPGWYQIASVAGGAATLTATIGSAVLYTTTTTLGIFSSAVPAAISTVAGCASVASPTAAHWTVDYSQQTAVQFAPTTYSSPSSSAGPVMNWSGATKAMIGNGVMIPSGVTNATAGYYQILSAVAGTSISLDRNWNTSTVTTGGAAIGIGGGFASDGAAAAIALSQNIVFTAYNASVYPITSASTNISNGAISSASNVIWCGYNTSRFLGNTDANKPTLQIAPSTSGVTIWAANTPIIMNMIMDGNSNTTSKAGAVVMTFHNCTFKNFTGGVLIAGGLLSYCQITGCSTVIPISTGTIAQYCEAFANTVTPFSGSFVGCLSYNNTGATTDGFVVAASGSCRDCVSYGNGRYGFSSSGVLANCIAEANTNVGFQNTSATLIAILLNCGSYNNSARSATTGGLVLDLNPIVNTTGSFFVSPGANNFALNNTANQGALARVAAFPSIFPTGVTNNYADVGAAQSEFSTSAGGAPIFLVG